MNMEIDTFITNELTKAEARKSEFIESIRSKYPNVARFVEGKSDDLYLWYSSELVDVIAALERQAARERLPTPSLCHAEGFP